VEWLTFLSFAILWKSKAVVLNNHKLANLAKPAVFATLLLNNCHFFGCTFKVQLQTAFFIFNKLLSSRTLGGFSCYLVD
jgi:hypothetical protein